MYVFSIIVNVTNVEVLLLKRKSYTVAGTDINEVKRLNASSGLSYNEALNILAQTGGYSSSAFLRNNMKD
jgi:hypothetical protein